MTDLQHLMSYDSNHTLSCHHLASQQLPDMPFHRVLHLHIQSEGNDTHSMELGYCQNSLVRRIGIHNNEVHFNYLVPHLY